MKTVVAKIIRASNPSAEGSIYLHELCRNAELLDEDERGVLIQMRAKKIAIKLSVKVEIEPPRSDAQGRDRIFTIVIKDR